MAAACSSAQPSAYTFADAQAFLSKYCQACHAGRTAVGGFNLQRVATPASLRDDSAKWTALQARVAHGEMPPKNAPAPDLDTRERFTAWVDRTLHTEACAAGVTPGPAFTRRLNRDEYAATLRDLLDIHLDIAAALPVDGAGGEGFDNAAETLFLSPLHAEKYMDLAKFAMDFAAKEFKSRTKILIAKPGDGVTADQAAHTILKSFLPRAFRRPVGDADIAPYLDIFRAAMKQGQPFDGAVFFTLRAVLVSPYFLFRVEPPNTGTEAKPVAPFALASRISYFLWSSMPDELLFDVAASGKLQDPEVLQQLTRRMLRNDRALDFSRRFVEQWLRTRDLAGEKAPDAKLFPAFAGDEELRSDIRYQPVLFFREVLVRNLPLTTLIDSQHTIATSNLTKHFGEKIPLRAAASKQPHWIELPEGSHRGGLLGMPAVLAVSSYPYRTSPVLRGAWIMESMLGTPPPPPPPNVPALEEPGAGAPARTVRERLAQHRSNPVCASCHSRIDPLGFALENYDVVGRWRTEEAGKPVDASGELMDGTKVNGPHELKKALLDRKDLFVRNLASKMLGYALNRGLTLRDSCTVDQIVAKVKDNNYSAQSLVEAIVQSTPFRYQAARPIGTMKPAAAEKEQSKP